MSGKVILAFNIAAFREGFPKVVIGTILMAAAAVAAEAGGVIAGAAPSAQKSPSLASPYKVSSIPIEFLPSSALVPVTCSCFLNHSALESCSQVGTRSGTSRWESIARRARGSYARSWCLVARAKDWRAHGSTE